MSRIVAFVAMLCFACSVASAELRGDMKRLQGTWRLVSVEKDGRLLAGPAPRREMIIEGERWRASGDDPGEGTLSIDASARPKRLDLTRAADDGSIGRTAPCLYRLEGDRLSICREPVGPGPYRRPDRFSAAKGSGTLIFTWRRDAAPAR